MRHHKRHRVCALLIGLLLALQAHLASGMWRDARGFEHEWVAFPLSQGHGYSFESSWAWLGPYETESGYSPTAWIEPFQTALMAACFRMFGEQGRLVLLLLNFLWLAASCVVVYQLGRRLSGEVAGWAGALLLAFLAPLVPPARWVLGRYIGNAAPAGFLIALSALALISCMERPTLRRGVVLGTTIGLTNLTHAGSILFAPISAVMIAWGAKGRLRIPWVTIGTVLLVSGLVVSPWMMRNYSTFGRLVPLRNGAGFQLYIGNPALARTFSPGIDPNIVQTAPPWTAGSPSEAVAMLTDLEKDRALRNHAAVVVKDSAPEGFSRSNEAERDGIFRQRAVRFIFSHPLLTARMMGAKANGFFFTYWGGALGTIAALALVGATVTLRDRRVVALVLLILGYSLAYILTAPLYYRYRISIEPLMLVLVGLLAGAAVLWVRSSTGSRVWTTLGRWRHRWSPRARSGKQSCARPSPRALPARR